MKTPLLLAPLLLAFASAAFAQGPLTPPPGPPAPTMKRLDEVEPRVIVNATNTPGDAANSLIISAPGSYYLTGNVTGEADKHGISIQASDVTLDLNGFAVIGGSVAGTIYGIHVTAATPARSGITVRNGSVRGWRGGGVHALAATIWAEKLGVSDNLGAFTIPNPAGIAAGNGSMIKDCVATGNAAGFYLADRTQAVHCISTRNGFGFEGASYVTIVDCTASRNTTHGISVGSSALISRCSATRNESVGILAGPGSSVAGCVAEANVGDGISVTTGSSVQGCTVQANTGSGISVNTRCQAVGNTGNGNRRGIYIGGNGSRIDGNACTGNTDEGYWVVGANNFLVRNTSQGNTTHYRTDGNAMGGPVENIAVSGTIPAAASPWANFIH